MPRKYWRNLPEATLITPLIASARQRTHDMVSVLRRFPESVAPFRRPARARSAPLKAAASTKYAGQPRTAKIARCGNLRRKPCLEKVPPTPASCSSASNPAIRRTSPDIRSWGRRVRFLIARSTAPAVNRDKVYVTNAVKHFKFEPRGKRRRTRSPPMPKSPPAISSLEREVTLVKPALIVAMGATAARALTGRATGIGKVNRRSPHDFAHRHSTLPITGFIHRFCCVYHPENKAREYERFVADMKSAAPFAPHGRAR